MQSSRAGNDTRPNAGRTCVCECHYYDRDEIFFSLPRLDQGVLDVLRAFPKGQAKCLSLSGAGTRRFRDEGAWRALPLHVALVQTCVNSHDVQTCSVHNYLILLHRNRHHYRRIPSLLTGNTSSHHPIPRISPSRSSSPSQCRNRPLAHWPFTPLPHPACMHACRYQSLSYPARGNPPARPRRLQAPPQFPLRHYANHQKNAEMSMSSRQRTPVYRI
jgi:hypothetical protein